MATTGRRAHWQNVYQSKSEQQVSWSQPSPQPSLGLVEKFASDKHVSIVDVGGGASRLVDALLDRGFEDLTVLDLSDSALQSAKQRLGPRGAAVQWIAADITVWQPPRAFDVWHDRAAFHFLVEPDDRAAYLDRLRTGVRPGGHAIIATFALDGPEKCSGLPVHRYDPQGLSDAVGPDFELVAHEGHRHTTPWGAIQSFQFSVLRRR
jgi:2-polyprenyl-3-methyl-5-hydroxy-6-metoxy-1,4-benzoquinol methylase